MNQTSQFLSREQVFELNYRHGWFQYGDAQGDVSRAFAQDAIAIHERIRVAAPVMYTALRRAELVCAEACEGQHPDNECWVILKEVREAIAAAEE